MRKLVVEGIVHETATLLGWGERNSLCRPEETRIMDKGS